MRSLVMSVAAVCTVATTGYAQLPDGHLLWSMDSVYVLVTVDDAAGILSRRGLENRVHTMLDDAGLTVSDAVTPGFVVRATVRESAVSTDSTPHLQLLLSTALTDNVTRVKYVDAALTRCMSAEGCRRNVEGARALGSWGILWREEWLGSAGSAESATLAIDKHLDVLVRRFLAAHATANHY